jgi:hypothetical protein
MRTCVMITLKDYLHLKLSSKQEREFIQHSTAVLISTVFTHNYLHPPRLVNNQAACKRLIDWLEVFKPSQSKPLHLKLQAEPSLERRLD